MSDETPDERDLREDAAFGRERRELEYQHLRSAAPARHSGSPLWRTLATGLMYAVLTAGVILALFSFTSGESRTRTQAAIEEIHAHRIASRCANADIVDGVNRLLQAAGEEPVPTIDLTGFDCSPLPTSPAEPSGSVQP